MTFMWLTAIVQAIVLALVILFFVSIFLFVNRIINHTKETQASLRRMEEYMEIIINEMKKKDQI